MIKIYIYLCVILALAGNVLKAQEVEILTQKEENGSIEVSVKNKTKWAQSVELDCKLKDMKASADLPQTKFVGSGETVSFVTLSPIDPTKAHSFGTSIRYIEGNVLAVHDDSYIYGLPFPKGKSYSVGQGYHGNQTHQGKYALDFNMDEGSEIAAVRDGIVTKVVENNDRGCPNEKCHQYNNIVLVTHSDGSVADYSHLKKNGAKVKLGDEVTRGQVIGLSGATGWASGAHLHLEIYTPTWGGQKSVKIQYQLDQQKVGIPLEKQSYTQVF